MPLDHVGNSTDLPTFLNTVHDEVAEDLAGPLTELVLIDDEIDAAAAAKPSLADVFFHSFDLLRPRSALRPAVAAESVLRSHVRELLARLGAGADTGPPTSAEMFVAVHHTGRAVPLHGPTAGLYFRLLVAAFPAWPGIADLTDRQRHYEVLYGGRIDDLVEHLRRRLADPDRRMPAVVTCRGRHRGEAAVCRYADTRALPVRAPYTAPPQA
ncbi:hypothetical protein [Catellatospora methionotrophica]|uniref:hypothetical protein n=1 Tax=Catellatospora methionotrophica TaxID=121620 RepID=UPI0033F42804